MNLEKLEQVGTKQDRNYAEIMGLIEEMGRKRRSDFKKMYKHINFSGTDEEKTSPIMSGPDGLAGQDGQDGQDGGG